MNGSSNRSLSLGNVYNKIDAFGFNVKEINGHDHSAIIAALTCCSVASSPIFIVANTIKGYGVKRMENNPEWHHKIPTQREYEEIISELDLQ
jgi:transketolase